MRGKIGTSMHVAGGWKLGRPLPTREQQIAEARARRERREAERREREERLRGLVPAGAGGLLAELERLRAKP